MIRIVKHTADTLQFKRKYNVHFNTTFCFASLSVGKKKAQWRGRSGESAKVHQLIVLLTTSLCLHSCCMSSAVVTLLWWWGLHLWCCALCLKKDWTSKENSSRDQQEEHWRKENKFFIHNSWCSQQDKLLGIYSKNPAALITWNIWHTLSRRNLPRQWNSKYQWNGH